MTGANDEDLVKKLGDIAFYQESTKKDENTLWQWLTNACLQGRAQIAFRTAFRMDSSTVDTFDKVLAWLFTTFDENEPN